MKIVKVLKTTLKSSLKDTGTTIVVQAFVDSDGNEVALADFGGSYFYVVIKQGSKIEIIKCDGVTQNSDGSASLSVATSGRSIPPKSPFTGASTGKAFQTGAELIVTNDPATMAEFAQLGEDNAFTGANTFTQFPKKSGSLTPTDDEDFVTLAHLNATVLGDATVSALKSTVTFGEDVSEGDPVYFKVSDGKWWRAYANNAATCIDVELAIVDADAVADDTGAVVRVGRKGNFTGLTLGKIYLTDAGGVGSAGSYIVELGKAVATDAIYVNPKDGDREQFMAAVTGMLVPFAGVSVPTGFLACNGQAIAYTDYPDLWGVIFSKYGLGSGQSFTVTAANDTVDIVSHGFSNGDIFILSNTGGALPAGLTEDTVYYVVESTTNTFKLSLTNGGSAVDMTDAGTGTHKLHTTFKVPDLGGKMIIGTGAYNYGNFTIDETDIDTTVGTWSATNATSDWVTVTNGSTLKLGDQITFGTTYAGLTANTIYYAIPYSYNNIRVATSYANAIAGTYIQISTTVSGLTYNTYRPARFTLSADAVADLADGDEVVLTTDGTLPTNIPAGTYYAIMISSTVIELTDTYAKATSRYGGLVGSSNGAGSGSGTSYLALSSPSKDVGDTGGEAKHILTIDEMPSHTHTNNIDNSSSGAESLTGSPDDGAYQGGNYATGATGGDEAHNNMSPYVVANWIIKT